jgi:hypothetical protein
MIKLQSHIKVGNLVVVYAAVLHLPQWYVATADGILIFGPFSSLEEAMEAARGTNPPDSASEKGVLDVNDRTCHESLRFVPSQPVN